MQLLRAVQADAPHLTAVAFAAKRQRGYPEAWIQHWCNAITITSDYIAANPTFVATDERGEILGFATPPKEAGECWIDRRWVLPAAMGRGLGDGCASPAKKKR